MGHKPALELDTLDRIQFSGNVATVTSVTLVRSMSATFNGRNAFIAVLVDLVDDNGCLISTAFASTESVSLS